MFGCDGGGEDCVRCFVKSLVRTISLDYPPECGQQPSVVLYCKRFGIYLCDETRCSRPQWY